MLECNGLQWAPLVLINNDEGDHFQPMSPQSTPFNAQLEWCSVHDACARVGLRGSPVGPQVVKNDFFQSCS